MAGRAGSGPEAGGAGSVDGGSGGDRSGSGGDLSGAGGDDAVARRAPEKTAAWRTLAVFAIPLLGAIMRFRIRGREHIPASGAFILAPNHFSNIDPVVMGLALWKLGRVPRFLAKASLFRVPLLGGMMRALGQIPVERAGGGDPLAGAAHLIAQGHAVIIYPEGTLTREPDLWPMRGKTGVVRAALAHGVPVVPAAHWGTQRLLARYSTRLRPFPRKTIDIAIGPPVDLSRWRGRELTTAELAAATEAVMHDVTGLVAELRGEPAPTGERWDPAKHGQSDYGRVGDGRPESPGA
jgi:1-acyl-sn-glycerol-3-phosphate acyltransferase